MTSTWQDPKVARTSACALGLAFAGRKDAGGVREVIDISDGEVSVLIAARDELDAIEVIEGPTRRKAERLLDAAAKEAARRLARHTSDDELDLTG